jgi:hypothetical protein
MISRKKTDGGSLCDFWNEDNLAISKGIPPQKKKIDVIILSSSSFILSIDSPELSFWSGLERFSQISSKAFDSAIDELT